MALKFLQFFSLFPLAVLIAYIEVIYGCKLAGQRMSIIRENRPKRQVCKSLHLFEGPGGRVADCEDLGWGPPTSTSLAT